MGYPLKTPKKAQQRLFQRIFVKRLKTIWGRTKPYPHTIETLSAEDKFIYNLEQRWTRKLLVSSMSGQTEAMRQKGMYVDLDGDAVTSSPLSVDGVTSQYWINAADRALLILRDGNFKAPYGSLATYLESLERPFNPLEKALELDAQIKWLKDTNAW